MSQSVPVYSFVADTLSSLPDAPQPTKFSDRNVSQNAAFLDFQASYALFSNATSVSLVTPATAAFSIVLEEFALFAAFPKQVVKTSAAAAAKTKCFLKAMKCCLQQISCNQCPVRALL